jgi:hypothetical protein
MGPRSDRGLGRSLAGHWLYLNRLRSGTSYQSTAEQASASGWSLMMVVYGAITVLRPVVEPDDDLHEY